MIEAPKKFQENSSVAMEIKKNETEYFGLDQDGVAKTIAAELLLTKENVELGNVTNPGLANGSTLATDLKLITISGNYIYSAGATNAPTAAAGYAQVVIKDENNRLVVANVASGDGIVHIYHMQMVAGVWTDWSQAYELNYAKLNYVQFNENITTVPTAVGSIYWDDDAKTVSLVLPDGVIAQIPEELYVNVVRDSEAPNPIVNGSPVYTIGEQGQKPRVGVARADTKAKTLVTGIATHDIANQGRITTFGLIRAVPLSVKPSGETWVAGNYLWLAPTGGMTNIKPSSPTPNVRLGLITNVTGTASFDMLVYIRPAMSLYDLYDVNGDAPVEGSELSFDFVNGYWKATNRLTQAEADILLKLNKSDVADNYDGGATKALSAEKGKDLNARLTAAETVIDYLNNRSVKIYGAAFGVTSDTSERLFDAVNLVARRANGSVNSEKSDFLSVGPWARMKKVLFDNTSVIKAEMGDTLFNALRATDLYNEGTKFEKFYSFDGEVTIGGVRKRVMLVSDYNVKHIYLGENEGSPVYVDLTCEPKFIREDGTERPYTIISSCHTGRDGAGTLWFGKPGVFPEVNRSIVNFDTLYPTGMYGYHFASSSILEKLLSIEWCSLNSQASVGAGINASMPYGSGNEFKCTVSQTGANSIIIANAGAVNMRVGMVMQIGTSYTSQNVAANRTITLIEDYDASNKRITVDGAAFDSVSGTTTIVSWGQPVPKSQLESMGLDCGWISQFDSENRSHVFAYGIADVWGNVWSFERGKMRNNGRWYFCWHPAQCKGVSNPVGVPGYIDSLIDFYMPGNGYLKEVQFFNHEGKSTWFPKAVGASSASYYADYCYYFTSDMTGVRVVQRFGLWSSGSGVGLWCVLGGYTPGNTNFSVSDRGIQDAA